MKRRSRKAGLAGLGALGLASKGAKPSAKVSKGVLATVQSFIAGQPSRIACHAKAGQKKADVSDGDCAAVTDGTSLKIRGETVATKKGLSTVNACPAKMTKTAAGRAAANTMLRLFKTRLHYRNIDGADYFSGGKSGGGLRENSACHDFHVPSKAAAVAKAAATKAAHAEASKVAAEKAKVAAEARKQAKRFGDRKAAFSADEKNRREAAGRAREALKARGVAFKAQKAAEARQALIDESRMGSDFKGLAGRRGKKRRFPRR
jgi:hypothetical protein